MVGAPVDFQAGFWFLVPNLLVICLQAGRPCTAASSNDHPRQIIFFPRGGKYCVIAYALLFEGRGSFFCAKTIFSDLGWVHELVWVAIWDGTGAAGLSMVHVAVFGPCDAGWQVRGQANLFPPPTWPAKCQGHPPIYRYPYPFWLKYLARRVMY